MRVKLKPFVIGLSISLLGACTSFKGEYADPNEKEIVDDRWNNTDARKTAEVLINGMLKKPWLQIYKQTNKKKRPVVIVDQVQNRTDEHIDIKSLTEYVRDELINSGSIRFVNAAARDKILKEIKYQQDSGMVSGSTQKKKGRQIGADFFLGGAISSQVNSRDGYKTVVYQTNLILTNLETSEIVWSQKYQIKKRFSNSALGL